MSIKKLKLEKFQILSMKDLQSIRGADDTTNSGGGATSGEIPPTVLSSCVCLKLCGDTDPTGNSVTTAP